MTEQRTMLIPGAETPEGQERIRQALDERHDIDFEAFRVLRRVREEGLLSLEVFATFYAEDFDKDEAREFAQEVIEEIDDIIRRRILSDDKVLNALAGRPDDREGK